MSFPTNIREKILIDSARHCCVCHRYKGVKIEVHHIKPKALGGEDTYDNAIALCFDCHSDAGHYNQKHPKGSKFSESELKKAKERWLCSVKENNIPEHCSPDRLYCRYYLCKNYEHLVEISQRDLSKFPVTNPLLIENSIFNSLKHFIAKHPESYRHANAYGKALSTKEEYRMIFPDAIIPSKADFRYSYFDFIRKPSKKDLESLREKDGLVDLMLNSDLSAEDIAIVVAYHHGCWGVELQEEYIFRQLWCSFLAITNLSDRPIALDSITGEYFSNKFFQHLNTNTKKTKAISLPKAPIRPNDTVLLPLGVILPPFYSEKTECWSETDTYDRDSHYTQTVCHQGITEINSSDYLVYGNQLVVTAIKYKTDRNLETQEIHELDLSNMYTINRSWSYGSCPHVFFLGKKLSYYREILSHCCLKLGNDSFNIPEGINSIIIAEIEDEIAEIQYLKIDGKTILKNFKLEKNDIIILNVTDKVFVEIFGKYIPNGVSNSNWVSGIQKNELISNFYRLRQKSFDKLCKKSVT